MEIAVYLYVKSVTLGYHVEALNAQQATILVIWGNIFYQNTVRYPCTGKYPLHKQVYCTGCAIKYYYSAAETKGI